ncbi:MAG: glycosyltransferase family 1 protein [Patescibacteria group bacterium]|jgi:glycosyltransferase involved in cell wall biosynthesis
MRTIIDTRPMLEGQRSGVANYAARLVSALLDRAADPATAAYTLFCNASGRRYPADVPAAGPTIRHSFHAWPNRLLNLSVAAAGRPLIEELAGPADIVYLPNLNFVATRLPLVATVHDLSFVRYPEFFSAKQRLWHDLVRPAELLRRSAAIAAVSEHTKTDIIDWLGLSADRIAVVSPAAGEEFRPAGAEAVKSVRRTYGLDREFFLVFSTLEPRKNITGAIAAFEKLGGDTELVIAGGKGWLYDGILRRAAASPAKDRIRFLGYVPDRDRPALYAAALALVYPSFYEGFGMPPLEAMTCGTPVIASFASSLGEVVGAAGLLVDPYNASELAEAMDCIRREEALRRSLSAAGLARAKNYSWEKSAAALEQLLRTAALGK